MNNKEKEREIRTSWKMRALGALVGWMMRFFAVTLRMEVVDRCHGDDRPDCPILDDLACGHHEETP